ncbi:hypothetical protein N0V95_002833 [Ascochyta clinopodiicola]|nr:hypothetical protein N0V95_002833 [Ascochyta clinopodiicola]
MFYTRRPDFTPGEFREHMETKYLPIVKDVMGLHMPITTTLRYVERCSSGFGDRMGATLASKYKNTPDAPVLLVGYPKDLGWDAMVEMSFEDDLHLMQGYAATNSAEGQRIRDAEEEFTVPDAMKVVLMDRVMTTNSSTDCSSARLARRSEDQLLDRTANDRVSDIENLDAISPLEAAMAEDMAENADPGDAHISAYTKWGSGGWGGVLTGNVEVSSKYRGSFKSVVAKPTLTETTRDVWKQWALTSQQEGTPTIVQLVHPGRQSPPKAGERGFFDQTIAPSPIPLNIGNGLLERALQKVAFGTPREMTIADIEEVIDQFSYAAKLAYETGFKGVELHAAHGYLLSTFLTPKTNLRTDAYGGTPAKRSQILIDVIRAVRKVVPDSFCVGIKINSADVGGDESLEESLEQVGLIAAEQIDFLEISGGSYEKPRMAVGDQATRSEKREAFFLDYASTVRERYPKLVLMVTGGFRSRKGMEEALQSGACDLIGIGRPAAVWPHLPKDVLLNDKVDDTAAVKKLNKLKLPWLLRILPIKFIGTGADTVGFPIWSIIEHKLTETDVLRKTDTSHRLRENTAGPAQSLRQC